MEERYEERYSERLGRNMGHAVFGHAGKLCLAFGPQNGHLWDFRNFGMVIAGKPPTLVFTLFICLFAFIRPTIPKYGPANWPTRSADMKCL